MITGRKHVTIVNNTKLEIRLNKDVIVCGAPYRLSLEEGIAVREIINYLKYSIIQECESSFASLILLVKKKILSQI